MVDEDVFVDRESERDEHRRCLFAIDFWADGKAEAVIDVDSLDATDD